MEDEDFQSLIMNAWCTPTDPQSSHSNIILKIKQAQSALRKRNHEKFENIARRIDDLRLQMVSQFKKDDDTVYTEMTYVLFEDLLKQESLWKQESHE